LLLFLSHLLVELRVHKKKEGRPVGLTPPNAQPFFVVMFSEENRFFLSLTKIYQQKIGLTKVPTT